MVTLPIYMDSHATTRLDPRVLEAMLPYFGEHFGNPASRSHAFGWKAAEAVDAARRQLAALIGARPSEIVFTSGATESNNLAIKGLVAASGAQRGHVVTVATEHRAVLDPCRRLEAAGCALTVLPVGPDGLIDLEALARAITPETVLVSVMAINNEIGVRQPLPVVAELAASRGVALHTDAAQAVGRVPFDVHQVDADLVSISAHKMHGPKGVGALYVRRRETKRSLQPQVDGGGHERGLRSGTLNVAGIVGFGRAATLAATEMPGDLPRIAGLRDRLWHGLRERLDAISLNGSWTERVPHNLNVSFAHVDGEALLTALDDVAVSSGSACASATDEPSYVVRALGASRELARASVRFGLSRDTTEAEVDYVVDKVARVVCRLRELSPLADEAAESAHDPAVAQWLAE